MKRTRRWVGILLGIAVLLFSPAVEADESDPLPAPKGTPREQAANAYNEGVKLLRDKHYAIAQEKFERALALDEALTEAHNNLAFSLRLQAFLGRLFVLSLRERVRVREVGGLDRCPLAWPYTQPATDCRLSDRRHWQGFLGIRVLFPPPSPPSSPGGLCFRHISARGWNTGSTIFLPDHSSPSS